MTNRVVVTFFHKFWPGPKIIISPKTISKEIIINLQPNNKIHTTKVNHNIMMILIITMTNKLVNFITTIVKQENTSKLMNMVTPLKVSNNKIHTMIKMYTKMLIIHTMKVFTPILAQISILRQLPNTKSMSYRVLDPRIIKNNNKILFGTIFFQT